MKLIKLFFKKGLNYYVIGCLASFGLGKTLGNHTGYKKGFNEALKKPNYNYYKKGYYSGILFSCDISSEKRKKACEDLKEREEEWN